MADGSLKVIHVTRVGWPVHAVALSGNGNHLLIGTEHDLRLMDPWGNERLRHAHLPPPGSSTEPDMPFHAVALAPDLAMGLAVQRTTGKLYRLEITLEGDVVVRAGLSDTPLRPEPIDVYSLAFDAGTGLIAIGHVGPALTMWDSRGGQRWRQHPQDHNATSGKTWAVALSSDSATLYAGSSGVGRYILGAMDAATGLVRAAQRLQAPITGLAPLPEPLAVGAAVNDRYAARVIAYAADLSDEAWSYEAGYGERVTALATDPSAELLAVGTNAGVLMMLDALTGEPLAVDASLGSAVLSLSLAAGRYLAAGLQDGRLFYLEYTPPAGKGGMLL